MTSETVEIRACKKCQEPKAFTIENFTPQPGNRTRLRGTCRECHTKSVRAWQQANKEKVRAYQRAYKAHPEARERQRAYQRTYYHRNRDQRRAAHREWSERNKGYQRQRLYNLSHEDYERMLEAQGHACKICKRTDQKLHVDHCHVSGRIRGLLCFNCNTGLGKLGDDLESLQRAIDYLFEAERDPAESVVHESVNMAAG